MSPKYFGTDGIRGQVGKFPITVDFMLKLGWAIGVVLARQQGTQVLIGKDPRISGYMIESALQAGLTSAGMKIYLVGPMPTPAIAYLTQTLSADIGIVISASHNSYEDNGIKLFSALGFKFPDAFEHEIEAMLDQPITTADPSRLGKALRIEDAAGRYIEYCKSAIPHHTHFTQYKIVVDCANGATYHVAPHVYSELGATVITLHAAPNGYNINKECGSNHPEVVKEAVLKNQADIGIAFDGDGDRVVLVDHLGEIVDGDEILYIIAKGLVSAGNYTGGIISTHMSNIGLEIALNQLGLKLIRVDIGSQHVIQGLKENKWLLGGEPSGHITYLRMNTTDDGIITSLLVVNAMHMTGLSLHELKKGIKKFPQCIINIPHHGKTLDLKQRKILEYVKTLETRLGNKGQILLRYSGTEPIIRAMVQGEEKELVNEVCEELNAFIKDNLD